MSLPPPQLSHHVVASDGVVRVALAGEVDLAVADDLHHWLATAAAEHPGLPVEVDMTSVTFIDSSGIRAFVRARNDAVGAGRGLRLVNTAGMALRVLQVAGVYAHLSGEPLD
ncbi:STAS domain-containing protein [Catellatospora paridis]|uniref:STAS domain-containing protein n=1 Tax=Catellatospora paridis TaxID=1617086 RepID=UPI0018AF928D|nr:STAS domain-containing protein [Catellatospora paridis]